MDDFIPFFAVAAIFIAFPWIIFHYVTKWKTAATITSDDEVLLEELYNLAKRLDERMDTVERLVAADDPSFSPVKRIMADQEKDNQQLRELEQLIAEKKGTRVRTPPAPRCTATSRTGNSSAFAQVWPITPGSTSI